MPDIRQNRPETPPLRCAVCGKKPDKIEDTALHFGMSQRFGIIFIRAHCHNEKCDIACSFEWAKNHHEPIIVFGPVKDYGLRDLVERDGFALPKEADGARYQLAIEEPMELAQGKPRPIFAHLSPRFLHQMNRLVESMATDVRRDWETHTMTIKEMVEQVRASAYKLERSIMQSDKEPVPTADITELTTKMALIAMKIFTQIGTPEFQPNRSIDEVLNPPEEIKKLNNGQ